MVGLLCFPLQASATDFTSSSFIVKDPVIDGGSGYGASSNFQLWSSVAQDAIGISTSASHELRGGFLYFSEEDSTPSAGGGGGGSGGGGGGGGSSGGIIPPPPTGTSTPPFLGTIIDNIPQAVCDFEGFSRSDFNCDGKVNLKDLSILLTNPRIVTTRVLSFLFSDWTTRLPIPARSDSIAFRTGPNETQGTVPLAEAGSTINENQTVKETVVAVSTGIVTVIKRAVITAVSATVSFIGRVVNFFKR
ncbi:MAG: hypothetical protein AAB407_02220 [Patescibacteria group bacterium]